MFVLASAPEYPLPPYTPRPSRAFAEDLLGNPDACAGVEALREQSRVHSDEPRGAPGDDSEEAGKHELSHQRSTNEAPATSGWQGFQGRIARREAGEGPPIVGWFFFCCFYGCCSTADGCYRCICMLGCTTIVPAKTFRAHLFPSCHPVIV